MCASGTPPMFMAIDTVGGEQQQIYHCCYIIKEFKQANEIHILLCIRADGLWSHQQYQNYKYSVGK